MGAVGSVTEEQLADLRAVVHPAALLYFGSLAYIECMLQGI